MESVLALVYPAITLLLVLAEDSLSTRLNLKSG